MAPKASKLDPFMHLLGKVPDERIAEMAGLAVSTVEAVRRRLGKTEGREELQPPEQVILEARKDYERIVEAATPLPDPPEPEPPCPPCIRVVKPFRVPRCPPADRPRAFGRHDVFGSLQPELREWLWAHHRARCEPFGA
jgi:hypothetical protein